jgi:hypothetical protein
VLRWLGWGIVACFRLQASLVMENVCLRQQLLVVRRRQPRPRIRDADRRGGSPLGAGGSNAWITCSFSMSGICVRYWRSTCSISIAGARIARSGATRRAGMSWRPPYLGGLHHVYHPAA